jgi:HAD superfamily hydrolase (TIGR01490 family)
MTTGVVAFFDLDKTLMSINSAPRVFARSRREGRVGLAQALGASVTFGLYALGLRHVDDLIRLGAIQARGHREQDIIEWYRRFWDEEIRDLVRPGARAVIEHHRLRGDRTAILTSSTIYIARLAAAELGIDDAVAPRMIVQDGYFTGECEEPLCSGPGKIVHAGALADRAGVRLDDCAFYTDSYTDIALLERVGTPVAVNPDPRLRRVARRRKWPIVDWGC